MKAKTNGRAWFLESNGYNGPLGHWHVQARPDVSIRLKRVFPRAEARREGFLRLSASAEVARDLVWVMERWPLEMTRADRARLGGQADEHRRREEVINEILTGARPHLQFVDPVRPARDYQLVAADLALETGRLLLCDDLGLGKSMSGILVLRNPEALPAIVVCRRTSPGSGTRRSRKPCRGCAPTSCVPAPRTTRRSGASSKATTPTC